MTTEERLAKVERELGRVKRRTRWMVAVVGLAVVGLILAWTWSKITATTQTQAVGRASKVIRANALILEDLDGRDRVILCATADGAGLDLLDAAGNARAGLRVGADGPGLSLWDENGKTRAMLDAFKDGPGLSLRDEAGKAIWSAP